MTSLLDERIRRRQVTRLLHSHVSPVLWRDPLRDPTELTAFRRRVNARTPKTVNLYVGTPYCLPTNPDRCGFCLFPSEVFEGNHQLETYLSYLKREGEMYRRFFEGDQVESIYFGGGTSNLYKPRTYAQLMGIVRQVFPSLSSEVEVTLEGIPQTYTRDKLVAMRDAGVNRISIGVQQFDDELIKLSGRKQKRAHTLRVLEWCRELGLRASVDLIYGWPRQTLAHMLKDLETAIEYGVDHITHYELNLGGRTDFARNHADTLPTIEQNLDMYRAANAYMRERGYSQVSTYDWRNSAGKLHYEEVGAAIFYLGPDGALCGHDTWGWGFAGVSNFLGTADEPGWLYMNPERVRPYMDALDDSRFPIARAYRCNTADLKMIFLFQSLIANRIDRKLYAAAFGCDVYDEHRGLWEALADKDWIEVTPEMMRLKGDGVFYSPTVQGIIGEPRVREVQRNMALARGRKLPVVSDA